MNGYVGSRLSCKVLSHSCVRVRQISELWEQYIQKFDVVIVNDGSMQHVHELLNDIIAGQLPEEEH